MGKGGEVAAGRLLRQGELAVTEQQMEAIAAAAATRAVEEFLVRIGVDPDRPIEMQKDFAYLRDWRISVEAAKQKGLLALVAVLVTGLAGACWVGIKAYLHATGN